MEVINKSKEYNKKYYSNHKNDKFHCDTCNKDYSAFNKDQHLKTAKHIKNKNNAIVDNETLMEKMIKIAFTLGKKIEIKNDKWIIE
jgi:transposase-like protein